MPAGRYVKLDVFKPNGYATDRMARVSEIELYDDIAMGKTAVASDSGSAEHGPSNAVDGRDDTSWSSSATLITKDYKLQVSSDGLTYTDADTVLGNTEALTERMIPGASGRYFRLYITAPNQTAGDPTVTINDFELYDAGNLALGSTVTASTGANPTWAADGNGSTQWTSSATDADIWLKVDLGSVKRFNRWVVKQAGSNGEASDNNLFGYHLKVSEDDSADSYLMLDTVDLNTDGMTDRMINRSTFVKYKEYAYDFMKMAAAFQGIVNREGAHVFYKYEGSSDYVEYGTVSPSQDSSQWLLSDAGGFLRIKNKAEPADNIHIEDELGYAQYGGMTGDSSQWLLVPVYP
ncbi:discoidin domain-containing protein [Cohnella fermenti]|uniref:Discoidin domain-containing protein n=1 Tax=Cohnella fermenti TaxID=2565925 RepID=A0A4S4BEP5_9BACL|nr:discoidin domain-containing protein [Cohnella fermenti]THF72678.1 discoidin domain-containing protein [Cohnella fermenti]